MESQMEDISAMLPKGRMHHDRKMDQEEISPWVVGWKLQKASCLTVLIVFFLTLHVLPWA